MQIHATELRKKKRGIASEITSRLRGLEKEWECATNENLKESFYDRPGKVWESRRMSISEMKSLASSLPSLLDEYKEVNKDIGKYEAVDVDELLKLKEMVDQ